MFMRVASHRPMTGGCVGLSQKIAIAESEYRDVVSLLRRTIRSDGAIFRKQRSVCPMVGNASIE
jgi:hypothetical protein